MKITGIIAEYNPFHNGHRYHLQQSRALTNADYCVVIMSGNFVQRGAPAILDKYTRTRMALLNGADLVLELPLYYAAGSADFFAAGAVALLDKLGVADFLCFGSECGNLDHLSEIARILSDEPSDYKDALQKHLRNGLSFPTARSLALETFLPTKDCREIIGSPNNILGIEYLKALFKRNSTISPYTLERKGAGYHETLFPEKNPEYLSSATAIRAHIHRLDALKEQLPDSVYRLLLNAYQKSFPVSSEDFSLLLKYRLLMEAERGFADYLDINPDLSDKIIKNLWQFHGFGQFCALLKSKDITYSRLSRGLLHILLDMTKEKTASFVREDYISYARILGFRKSSAKLLKAIKQHTDIPLISKLADAEKQLTPSALSMLREDIRAAHLYDSVVCDKYHAGFVNEYAKPLVIIE